jgi:hypothetical protein
MKGVIVVSRPNIRSVVMFLLTELSSDPGFYATRSGSNRRPDTDVLNRIIIQTDLLAKKREVNQ